MARVTGVIYDLPMSKDCDGVHIETCGWDNYIIHIKDRINFDWLLVTMSRDNARELIQEWTKHIEESDEQDVLDSSEDEE